MAQDYTGPNFKYLIFSGKIEAVCCIKHALRAKIELQNFRIKNLVVGRKRGGGGLHAINCYLVPGQGIKKAPVEMMEPSFEDFSCDKLLRLRVVIC